MAGLSTHHEPSGGSRTAGYVLATLLGAPLVFLATVVILRSVGLAIAVSLMAAILGLTFALRAWSEDRSGRLPD